MCVCGGGGGGTHARASVCVYLARSKTVSP